MGLWMRKRHLVRRSVTKGWVIVETTYSKLKKDLVQTFECAMCAQIIYRPWSVIDCGHSFCEYCILAWEKTLPGQSLRSCPYCQKEAILVIPGTLRPTDTLLKVLEPFAQELEMSLDDPVKGDLDAEYAAKYSTPKYRAEWLRREAERVQMGLRSLMSWCEE